MGAAGLCTQWRRSLVSAPANRETVHPTENRTWGKICPKASHAAGDLDIASSSTQKVPSRKETKGGERRERGKPNALLAMQDGGLISTQSDNGDLAPRHIHINLLFLVVEEP